jgi:hypothetical protein
MRQGQGHTFMVDTILSIESLGDDLRRRGEDGRERGG